jgi:hypothetical protein
VDQRRCPQEWLDWPRKAHGFWVGCFCGRLRFRLDCIRGEYCGILNFALQLRVWNSLIALRPSSLLRSDMNRISSRLVFDCRMHGVFFQAAPSCCPLSATHRWKMTGGMLTDLKAVIRRYTPLVRDAAE